MVFMVLMFQLSFELYSQQKPLTELSFCMHFSFRMKNSPRRQPPTIFGVVFAGLFSVPFFRGAFLILVRCDVG